MSYYYTYYLGYKDKNDGKIYPLGPYDNKQNLHNVLCKSASFASDLHDIFEPIPGEEISSDLRSQFEYEDYRGQRTFDVTHAMLSDLPLGSIVSKGYCLREDVQQYLADEDGYEDEDDLMYHMLSESEFAMKAHSELQNGVSEPKTDDYGETIPVYSCKDYVYFSFLNTHSKAYESFLIRMAAASFEYSDDIEYDLSNVVVLLTQG